MSNDVAIPKRRVCVFCGSSPGADPAFAEAAEALGLALAKAGVGLVYGGGNNGLMGILARSVLAGGGHVTGIIPGFLRAKESMVAGAQEMFVTNDMHERKRMMFDRADAFIALPGGIGTLEELVEQLTWAQLGQHDKPILIADVARFWKPFLVLLAHMREAQFIRAGIEVHYLVAERMEEILPMLDQAWALKERAARNLTA